MKILILAVLVLAYSQIGIAQEFPNLKFSHITEKDGLSNANVNCLAQDKDGFIWVGTQDGLNRLDGYRIKKFFYTPYNENSLVNNYVSQIVPDDKNNLWISTIEGFTYFDKRENHFSNFLHLRGDSSNLRSDRNPTIFVDRKMQETWIGIPHALYRIKDKLQLQYFPIDTLKSGEDFANFQFQKMYKDREERLWAFFHNWIFELDPSTKQIKKTFHCNAAFVRDLYEDSNKNFWVATFGAGLIQFDPEKNVFKKIDLADKNPFTFSVKEWRDKNNRTWIVVGSAAGLNLLDPVTLKSKFYSNNPLDDYSISRGEILDLLVDRNNILWIASDNGVSYLEPSKQLIESWDITPDSIKLSRPQPGYAYGFFEDDDGYWMSNRTLPGLFHFDRNGNFLKSRPTIYPSNSKDLWPAANQVFQIIKRPDGTYWFSTEAGLVHADFKKNKSELFKPPGQDFSAGLRTIRNYNDSIWWIRTRNNGGNGIYVFNCARKKFIAHYYDSSGCEDCLPSYLQELIITKNHKIYASPSDSYLYEFDEKKNKFIPFFNSKETIKSIPSKTFDCMATDSAGNLWAGTGVGLVELDPINRKLIKDFSKDKRIGGVAIDKLCFDEDGNLWMNTERGLFCLAHKNNEVYDFNTGYGLPSNSMPGFLSMGKNGFMYAGALGFIVKFKPADLLQRQFEGDVQFSDVKIENTQQVIDIGESNEKKIRLDVGQNVFSVDFSILNYDNTQGNRYYYLLKGTMENWRENENGHLNFYDLPPGHYVLRVKGGNRYGEKFKSEAQLIVEVIPGWWQTKWFYFLLLMLAAFVVFIIFKNRVRNIRQESSLRAKIAESEMIALRAQMNPHFIFNCMNIIDGLITEDRKKEAKEFLQKFSKLTRLVLENSQYQLVPLGQDLQALRLYVELEAIRYNHRFQYEFRVDQDLMEENIKIPPLLLQPYVENAILHGLRHKENGTGKLSISISSNPGNLVVTIEDNGIGRIASSKINEDSPKPHQHLGMKLTAKRIELLRTAKPDKIFLEITDISGDAGTGTRVQIIFPMEFNIINTL